MVNKIEFLTELRKRIPFLNEIPDEIYFRLDISEFLLPDEELSVARQNLERKLNYHVMSYKLGILNLNIPPEKHLCAHLRPAKLTKNYLKILQSFENRFRSKDVSFVVYDKPLSLIPVSESDLYKLYIKKGLKGKN